MVATEMNYHVPTYKACEGGAGHGHAHDRGSSGWLCDECWDWLSEFISQKVAKSSLVQVEMDFRDGSGTVVAPVFKRVTVAVQMAV